VPVTHDARAEERLEDSRASAVHDHFPRSTPACDRGIELTDRHAVAIDAGAREFRREVCPEWRSSEGCIGSPAIVPSWTAATALHDRDVLSSDSDAEVAHDPLLNDR
jgi:hypothetical protein